MRSPSPSLWYQMRLRQLGSHLLLLYDIYLKIRENGKHCNSVVMSSQGSVTSGKHALLMSNGKGKTADEKPSPEQGRKASGGKKAPLFTSETRAIIWGVQARAVQVYLNIILLYLLRPHFAIWARC